MKKKTFVLSRDLNFTGPVAYYYISDGKPGICMEMVEKVCGSAPKYIGITVSNRRFLSSKRIYVQRNTHSWRWGIPGEWFFGRPTVPSAMQKLVNHGLVDCNGCGWQTIYFKITPLLTSFSKRV